MTKRVISILTSILILLTAWLIIVFMNAYKVSQVTIQSIAHPIQKNTETTQKEEIDTLSSSTAVHTQVKILTPGSSTSVQIINPETE